MNDFKGRHFEGEVVLWAVRLYWRYPISYRDLESMMTERGVAVDHSTIFRWVQRYAPEMERRLRWQWRGPASGSWRVDETHVRVRGKWAYLYRALDKFGNTIDFYLSATRNTRAAKRFLGKTLRGCKEWELPEVVNTDKAPTYAAAIAELKAEGKGPKDTRHRQVKYLNNVVEADHGKLKQLLRPVRGFKSMKTAYATIKGFEVMRRLRKGQAAMFSNRGEGRFALRLARHANRFGLRPRRARHDELALAGQAPPHRQLPARDSVPTRDFAYAFPRPQARAHHPRLLFVAPVPARPTRRRHARLPSARDPARHLNLVHHPPSVDPPRENGSSNAITSTIGTWAVRTAYAFANISRSSRS